MSSDAGKGDDYRKVNLQKFNKSHDRIFGERDSLEFQKHKNSCYSCLEFGAGCLNPPINRSGCKRHVDY